LPLLFVAVAPIICIPFVFLGICGQSEEEEGSIRFGMRTAMKGTMLAVRADIRMGRDSKQTSLLKKAGFKKGGPRWMQPTASAVEAGLAASRVRGEPKGKKVADQSAARAEENAIKAGAKTPVKTGASRFY